MSNLSQGILDGWHQLIQEIVLVKNHESANQISSIGLPAPNPILNYLLPSLFYIKLASLLDEALDSYIDSSNLDMPTSYRRNLDGRINFLKDENLLLDSAKLHAIRQRRNELAHKKHRHATWKELDNALDVVEAELQALEIVDNRPKYEFYAERTRATVPPKEGVAFAMNCCYGLKQNGEKVVELSWVEEVRRSSGRKHS